MFVSHDGHVRGYKWIYTYFVQNIVLHDKSIEREIYVYAYAYNHWPIHYYIHLVVLTIATEWTDDWEIWLQGAHIDLVIWDGPVSPPWNCHELSTFFFLHPQAQDQMLSICFLCVSSWQPIYRPSFCTRLGQFKMNEMVFCWGKTIVFFFFGHIRKTSLGMRVDVINHMPAFLSSETLPQAFGKFLWDWTHDGSIVLHWKLPTVAG